MKRSVQLVEVGLRDGLQNEKTIVDLNVRMKMNEDLIASGLKRIELGAFVRQDKVPQMAGSAILIKKALTDKKMKSVQFSALVPNEAGMLEAIKTGVKEVAIFASASEGFSKANINCTIEESFKRFKSVFVLAKKHKVKVRGYVSVCFGCPYDGRISPDQVKKVALKLYQMGCYEISIGDTLGIATPKQVKTVFNNLKKVIPVSKLAGHFHDTRGTALANIVAAHELGVRVFDTSIGGLGGCPYAPGSAGNVSTEDVVYLLDNMGINTGVNLKRLLSCSAWISKKMKRKLPSKLFQAGDWP